MRRMRIWRRVAYMCTLPVQRLRKTEGHNFLLRMQRHALQQDHRVRRETLKSQQPPSPHPLPSQPAIAQTHRHPRVAETTGRPLEMQQVRKEDALVQQLMPQMWNRVLRRNEGSPFAQQAARLAFEDQLINRTLADQRLPVPKRFEKTSNTLAATTYSEQRSYHTISIG